MSKRKAEVLEIQEKIYVFYDTETNGLDPITTAIMQLAVLSIDGTLILNQYVYPFDDRIDGTFIHGIDEEKLDNNIAVTIDEMCIILKNRLRDLYGRSIVYFIAYNNFGYDQHILENNFKEANIRIPDNWYFTDFMPIIKEIYLENPLPNYKLKTVFETICGVDETIDFHCAYGDTKCLHKIYEKLSTKIIPLLPKYTRSLLNSPKIQDCAISTIAGYDKRSRLEERQISKISDLYSIFRKNSYDKIEFNNHLLNRLGLKNGFARNNMFQNLTMIKYLS